MGRRHPEADRPRLSRPEASGIGQLFGPILAGLAVEIAGAADLTEEQRQVVSDGAAAAMAAYTKNVMEQEASLQATIEAEGIVFTQPDREAFRAAVQDKFKTSDLAKSWEEGMFDRIANLEVPASCSSMMN